MLISRSNMSFWTAFGGGWASVLIVAVELAAPRRLAAAVQPATLVVGGLAIIFFLGTLLDPATRRAVDRFNAKTAPQIARQGWWAQWFSPDYGDVRLLLANRLIWLEVVGTILMNRRDIGILGFAGFALTALGLVAEIKNQTER